MINFIGLDGKKYKLNTLESSHPLRGSSSKSNIQAACGELLRKHYPMTPILEEVSIPGHNFVFDFFIPTFYIAVEIDGIQHSNYVPFFHKNKRNFINAQERDFRKEELCKLNKWTFIRATSVEDLNKQLEA